MVGYSVLGTFGAYVFTSVVLLKFPTILHTKKKRKFCCSHISHRGGAAENPENTLLAFKHATECGTHLFELDVHLTKDSKVVVAHDGDLKRVTGVEGNVSDYNYEELPCLKPKLEVTFSKHLESFHDGEPQRFPLLADVFAEFPNMPVNIDIKDNDDKLIEETVKVVEKFQRENKVCWGNSNAAVIDKLYEMKPDVAVFFSMRRVLMLYVSFYTGLLPFLPLKESYLEVPLLDIMTKMKVEMGSGQKFLFRIVKFIYTSPVLFAHLRERGIPTYFWVLNDDEDFKRGFELGAEGVMTDCPSKLRRWLDEHPQYKLENQQHDIEADMKQKMNS